ncbi:MAG: ChaN family lipoprotein [Planctomycetes bacterium]|nr:ChaN family lipoprotein [Planctomycetota bacterium]
MRRELPRAACLSLLLCACSSDGVTHAGVAKAVSAAEEHPWSSPALEHCVSVRDGRTGARLSFEEFLDKLAQQDAVFLGETHIDETTHRVELGVYEGLCARRPKQVVLAMEMFERDEQPALDAYLAGTLDEAQFRTHARLWGNYDTAYRPLIEYAKSGKRPVVASNFPAPLRRKLDQAEGKLEALSAEERALAPAQLFANTPAYWRRVDNAIRGHAAMMGPKPAPDDPRLTSTQSLWDNTMGESCALALERHPGSMVLHVNGGFHSEYWDGTARQFKLRAPKAHVATVAITPVTSPESVELGGLPEADYIVLAEKRAQDIDEGTFSVFVQRKLEYRLYVPPQASAASRVPLFVWLADDGEVAADALALWRKRLGDSAAIAVVEPPYRETQEDLVEGGRWFWNDSFRDDVGLLADGIGDVWGYLLRHQPVDPERVVLAGEGTGATVVCVTALLDDALAVKALGFAPRQYSDIKDLSLPLPELRGDLPPTKKSLAIFGGEADSGWWTGEIEEYNGVGFQSRFEQDTADAWHAELEQENRVRAALGLELRSVSAGAKKEHVIVASPRARSWARPLALERLEQGELVALLEHAPEGGDSTQIDLAAHAADYASKLQLPRAPGPFGGTTVIVLPDGMDPAEVAAWKELESADPLARTSRFHRMVLASQSGERALPVVLAELQTKKRKNLLILPALWCADGAMMHALRDAARPFENTLTLHWRPGLGR